MTARQLALGILAALLLWPTSASALRVPWPCGVTYPVTQGHNTGSHVDEGGWAWDFGIPVGGQVAAPADGVVRLIRMDSTTGGCDSGFANDANYVVIDHGDGTESLLLHLQANSSALSPGDPVRAGDVVGSVGLTGWVCGAHLHYQLQNNCASWWCQSVPATFETFADPPLGTQIESDNCGGPPPECTVRVGAGGSGKVDELDSACFARVTSFWWPVNEGDAGHHYYTFATDAAQVETHGTWRFHIETGGDYRLEAFVPNTEADTRAAVYQVATGQGGMASRPVDQSAEKGWVDLGTFAFASGERSVRLGDNTGENYSQFMRKVAFDALRVTWVDPTPPMDPGGQDMAADTSMGDTSSADVSTSTDPSDLSTADVGMDTLGVDTSSASTSDGVSLPDGTSIAPSAGTGPAGGDMAASDATGPDASGPLGDASGDCACTVRGASSPRLPASAGLLLALGLLGLGRRRGVTR